MGSSFSFSSIEEGGSVFPLAAAAAVPKKKQGHGGLACLFVQSLSLFSPLGRAGQETHTTLSSKGRGIQKGGC